MIWLFLIAAIIVIFGFSTLMQIVGTMALIGLVGFCLLVVIGVVTLNQ